MPVSLSEGGMASLPITFRETGVASHLSKIPLSFTTSNESIMHQMIDYISQKKITLLKRTEI